MIKKFLRLQDHLNLHSRGSDRMATDSGIALFYNNVIKHVDDSGTTRQHLSVDQSGAVSDPSPGFGTWTEADANRPALLQVDATAETDGTSEGKVVVDIDEDGGTTADYSFTVAQVDPDNATGAVDTDCLSVYVPPGAQYQIRNASDPNGNNTVNETRQVTA